MEEQIVATIRRLITPGIRQTEYTLFLTDTRALFVVDRDVRLWLYVVLILPLGALGLVISYFLVPSTFGVIAGIMIGAYAGFSLGRLLMPRTAPPAQGATPDELAHRAGTRVIPFASLESVVIVPHSRKFPHIRFAFRAAGGGSETFELMLALEWQKLQTQTGRRIAERMAEREAEVRATLVRSLPPALTPRVADSR